MALGYERVVSGLVDRVPGYSELDWSRGGGEISSGPLPLYTNLLTIMVGRWTDPWLTICHICLGSIVNNMTCPWLKEGVHCKGLYSSHWVQGTFHKGKSFVAKNRRIAGCQVKHHYHSTRSRFQPKVINFF